MMKSRNVSAVNDDGQTALNGARSVDVKKDAVNVGVQMGAARAAQSDVKIEAISAEPKDAVIATDPAPAT